jgi:hypothetical protein
MNKMDDTKMDKLMLGAVSVACWGFAAWAVLTTTGCAGIELGGKVGIYEVETRDTQETVTTRAKPFICRLRQCDAAGNVIQGS